MINLQATVFKRSLCTMESKRIRELSPRKNYITPIKDIVLKILVIGDYGVGKTAVVKRYTQGKFSSNYKTTIGADFSVRSILWDANTRVSVQLWDIAGHERFNFMTRAYYKYAAGCVIVFDVTRHNTFLSAMKVFTKINEWLQDLNEKVVLDDGSNIPVVLLANKWDIEEHSIRASSISNFCKENYILNWFQASAKTNTNISEAIACLIEAALKNLKPIEKPIADVIELKQANEVKEDLCCR